VDVPAIGGDGVADEAREVGAEGEDQQRHHHLGHEQDDAAQQVGDVGEAQRIEADDQRAEDHQPVHQHAEDLGGVALDAAVVQEAVEAGALGDHVEVDGAQAPDDGEAHGLGHQPADDQDEQREHHARQHLAHLAQEHADRLEQHVDSVHALSSSMPRIPASGTCSQSGRLLNS
jgi:hypothetical protein